MSESIPAGQWHPVMDADALGDGEVAAATVADTPLAVFRLGEEVFALHDLCSHGNARLSEGFVEDGCIECPLHQGLFDIRNGCPMSPPVKEPVVSYPARVEAGHIQVKL